MFEIVFRNEKLILLLRGEELPVGVYEPLGPSSEDNDEWSAHSYRNVIVPYSDSILPRILAQTKSTLDFGVAIDFPNWIYVKGFSTILTFVVDPAKSYHLVSVRLSPTFSDWRFPYSFSEYSTQLLKLAEVSGNKLFVEVETNVHLTKEISIKLKIESNGAPFSDTLIPIVEEIEALDRRTVETITPDHGGTAIRLSFDFPEMVKSMCEQYLLYFATFLRDIGINAISNLKEDTGKVLFSVTPTDDLVALDKIREALSVYLNLPASPIVFDDSVKSMRLKQQIENLQHFQKMAEMEFRLAHKVIESQDKIIEEKNLTIEQQSKVIEKISSKSIMIDSAENKEELEELFEGVKVGKSKFLAEQLGLHLNPATALKSVGKKLIGKEGITSLNLDDELKNS